MFWCKKVGAPLCRPSVHWDTTINEQRRSNLYLYLGAHRANLDRRTTRARHHRVTPADKKSRLHVHKVQGLAARALRQTDARTPTPHSTTTVRLPAKRLHCTRVARTRLMARRALLVLAALLVAALAVAALGCRAQNAADAPAADGPVADIDESAYAPAVVVNSEADARSPAPAPGPAKGY